MFQERVSVETNAARIRQASIHDAMIYANAVAAIKVSLQGSQSVPSHQEVMEFLKSRGHTLNLQ
jgi:sugar/nucleoside kinase (ribokinase family)